MGFAVVFYVGRLGREASDVRGRTTLMAVMLGALVLGGCGGDDAPVTQPDAIATTAGSAASTPASGSETVLVSSVPSLGTVLVGPNGHTLYMFAQDKGTTSACTDGCAATWPALKSSGTPIPGEGVNAAKLSVAGGQVVYNGHLLYFFSGDGAPGDAKRRLGAQLVRREPGWREGRGGLRRGLLRSTRPDLPGPDA